TSEGEVTYVGCAAVDLAIWRYYSRRSVDGTRYGGYCRGGAEYRGAHRCSLIWSRNLGAVFETADSLLYPVYKYCQFECQPLFQVFGTNGFGYSTEQDGRDGVGGISATGIIA